MVNFKAIDWVWLWRWWSAELASLLPAATLARSRTPAVAVVVAARSDTFSVYVEHRGARQALAEDVELERLGAVLPGLLAGRSPLPVGLRLEAGACFSRDVELPAAVERDLERMLSLDLERTTPIKPDSVYTASTVARFGRTKGMLRVRQFITKRKSVDPLCGALRSVGVEPAFVDVWNTERSGGVGINFLSPVRSSGDFEPRALRTLIAAVVVLAISAVAILVVRKHEALALLESQMAEIAPVATKTRALVAERHRLDGERQALADLMENRPRATVILDDVAQLLPDDVWLQGLRLDGDVLELTGSARSAAALLALLERSGRFRDGQFATPIRLDTDSEREQFRLRAKVVTAEATVSDRAKAEAHR